MKNKDVKDTRMLSIGTLDVIFIVFVILKCLGLFPYSWLIVFSPLLLPFGLTILILGIATFFKK